MTDIVRHNQDQGACGDGATLNAFLRRAAIVDCKLVPWGSNYTFVVVMVDPAGDRPETICIYKPRAGETPLWDFPSGTLYQREYASFLLAHRLGWDFIPHTIIRDGPHGIGTVQLYVEPDEQTRYFSVRETFADDLRRIALFDLITNNADRKSGHFFRGKHDGRIWGIDHGLTFHVQPKLRTVIWDFRGETIAERFVDDLIRLYADDALKDVLRPHLDLLEIEALRGRVARVAEDGVFPELTSRRNIPYGW
ncbi:MAG TPA: SCO1664 family protein [Thermomicrobiales bacterium]|nr:SCO1664 family protein [Thermomicrobiales bacterium]